MPAVTLKTRYEKLSSDREPYLVRAREASALTIPSLVPPNGHTSTTQLKTPFQGLGARGVNNLASKLLLIILPTNQPPFRLVIDDFQLEALAEQRGARGKFEKAFARIERAVMNEIETAALRVPMAESLKHLLVSGNILFYLPDTGGARSYHLDKYVVNRDASGNVLEIVATDTVDASTLPDALRVMCKCTVKELGDEKPVTIYTGIVRSANGWRVWQEINDVVVPDSRGTYPRDRCPWLPLRLIPVDGEDYGRGYVEEYLGDLKSLEALSAAIVEGSAAASKVLFLVNPNGLTRPTVLESPNGSIKPGRKEDIGVVQMEKYNDFRIAYEAAQKISERLAFAFLLNSAVQRKAERVTAEEVRVMAGELDDALGGIYSVLAQELQLPLVNLIIHRMQKQKRLPHLPKGKVRPTIITGLQALGRGHDLTRLNTFLSEAAQLGPNVIAEYLNIGEFLDRIGASTGVDMEGLIRSEAEVAASRQKSMMEALANRVGPEVIKQAGSAVAGQ